MADQQSWTKRVEKFRASKTQVFWACAICIVATAIVGFSWGGWVTGATAREMTTKAAMEARAELAASFCVYAFAKEPDAATKLAALKGSDSWKRSEFIEKGGWVTVPGMDEAVQGAAALCAEQLMDAKALPGKSADKAG